MPDGAVYVQAPDRSSGIRLLDIAGVAEGDIVTLKGSMATDGGERAIIVNEVAVTTQEASPTPLTMTTASVGGSPSGPEQPAIAGATGLSNTGLLVRTAGVVTGIPDSTHFNVRDGSPIEGASYPDLRVEAATTGLPAVGDVVVVTGASGASFLDGTVVRTIRARNDDDIHPRNFLLNTSFETKNAANWSSAGAKGFVLSGPWYGVEGHSGKHLWTRSSTMGSGSGMLYQQADVPLGSHVRARVFSALYRAQNQIGDAQNRIGIDPEGGLDPQAPNVIWSPWDSQPAEYTAAWHLLETPVATSPTGLVTVFLDARQGDMGFRINSFDDAGLFLAD